MKKLETIIPYVYIFVCVIMVLWFGYWSFVWELIIWRKAPLDVENPFNYFMFGLGVGLLALKARILKVLFRFLPWKEPQAPPKWKRAKRKKKPEPLKPEKWKPARLFRSSDAKLRIPRLLGIKRIIACVLLIINFIFGESALTIGSNGAPVAVIFLANSFILLDYLWKTRKVVGVQLSAPSP